MSYTNTFLKIINDENITIDNSLYDKIYKENLSVSQIIEMSFEYLEESLDKYTDQNDINTFKDIRKTIELISFLCNKENINKNDISIYKQKIKNARENILIKANLFKNKKLNKLANKLDEISLSRNISKDELITLIKKLLDNNEDPNIIKKYININKSVIIDSCELFDYVFNLICDSLINDDRNILYYITMLKICYNSKINEEYYTNKLSNININNKLFLKEILCIIDGNKRPLNLDEIIEKYNINMNLKEKNIHIKNTSKTSDDKVITIDNPGTLARDDGLSLTKDGNNYIVGIHIADVASAIIPNSFLDKQAKENLKCIYFLNGARILPEKCETKLSLNKKQKRNVISLYVVLNKNGDFIDYYIKKNNVIIKENLSYFQSDQILNGTNSHELYNNLNQLFEISKILHEKSTAKIDYWEKKDTGKSINGANKTFKSKNLVSEFMVLYNTLLGQIAKNENIPYIYRYQDKEYISSLINELGIIPDNETNKIIESTYLVSKYSSYPKWHDGMGTDHYTQSVDPLRKYPDLYEQYLLHQFYFNDLNIDFDEDDFNNTIDYFNQRSQELVLMRAEYTREKRLLREI